MSRIYILDLFYCFHKKKFHTSILYIYFQFTHFTLVFKSFSLEAETLQFLIFKPENAF